MKLPLSPVEDNWSDHPDLTYQPVEWVPATSGTHPLRAQVSGQDWVLRMNDFPDEPMWTLLIDGQERIHFNNWPIAWGERPSLPSGDR